MEYKWLNKQNNNKLIIFFNGWGMDEHAVKHLEAEDYDIVMFYDYNNLDTDFCLDKEYSETNVVAWSMGVMIASICLSPHPNPILKKEKGNIVVINGTLKPIDVKYGINPKIYDLTIKGFNEESKDKFIDNMFDKRTPSPTLHLEEGVRTIDNLKSELVALKNYKADLNFKPDKILISANDKIIPAKNQCAFWNIEPTLDGGHYPFFNFKKWSEIL